MIIAKFAAVIIGGYILGSIPFGVIISRWSARVDVRDFGSGKTGATNVLRVAGKKAAVTAVLLDFFKGTLAVFLAGLLFRGNYLTVASGYWWLATGAQVLAAMAAVGGHTWPVFLSFRGGAGSGHLFRRFTGFISPGGIGWRRDIISQRRFDQICLTGFYYRGNRCPGRTLATHSPLRNPL